MNVTPHRTANPLRVSRTVQAMVRCSSSFQTMCDYIPDLDRDTRLEFCTAIHILDNN